MFAKMTLLTCISASTLALSGTAFAVPLVSCIGDGETFSVSLESEGRVSVNGASASLVSVEQLTSTGSGGPAFSIVTSTGNEIRVTQGSGVSSVKSYWDRGAIGSQCGAGSTLDTTALAALVARSKALSQTKWLLADCESRNTEDGHFKVTYHPGFAPGTLVLQSNVGPNGEEIRYVISSFEQDGAAGTFYTTLSGEGAYMYSGLGRHHRDLSSFVIAESNLSGIDRIEGRDSAGDNKLENSLGKCAITNLWHVEKLLTK